MKTYLISYDLIKPESSPDYARLISMIKSSKYWAKPLESVWLIKTGLSSNEVALKLKEVVDSNDKFLVIEITNDWTSLNLSQEVINWMRGGL